jgi:hypothetical protein
MTRLGSQQSSLISRAGYGRPRQSVTAWAAVLAALAVIAAAIGVGLGYAALALMAAAS